MQRWTTVIAVAAIIFLAATPANAFHHRYRGCGYGGCGYGGCGYGGYGYGGYGYGGYGYGGYGYGGYGYGGYGYGGGGPYAWGGYRQYYGYRVYGSYSNVRTPVYGNAVYGWNYAAPGYPSVNSGYAPPRPLAAPHSHHEMETRPSVPRLRQPATLPPRARRRPLPDDRSLPKVA